MRTHHLLLLSLSIVSWSCGPRAAGPPPLVSNTAGPSDRSQATAGMLVDGEYGCSFEQSGYDYPEFLCVVETSDGRTALEKLAGSQRIRGTVVPVGDGFRFDGDFYCPYGDCDQQVSGTFEPTGPGRWLGRLSLDTGELLVRLSYYPDGMGGGGGGYGGGSYGGYEYGY